MTKVPETAWVPKAKKRKAYRDHHREKFFSEVGLVKGAHVQDISGAPEQQRVYIRALLDLTAKGTIPDDAQKAYMTVAAAALELTGLGLGKMGGEAINQDILDRYSMKNLRDNWFWSPAFFD